ncbi:hypothetical protein AB0K48_38390 [Nonomuraea sp. NPDC055795]
MTRAWTEPSQPTGRAAARTTSGQVEPSEAIIDIFVFDCCGNITIIQRPIDVEQDPTDFEPFDVSYLWDRSGPPTGASAQGSGSVQASPGQANIPPPPGNDQYWQYGFNMVQLKKNWTLDIAMSSRWEPFPNCTTDECQVKVQWKLEPVRNAMKFYPRGRDWGTGPNAPATSWTSPLAKYILKNSTASITSESCFKVWKASTTSTVGFKIGFEGTQGAGDFNGNYQISTSIKDACAKVKRSWIRGYPNKPVTYDPDIGLGECEDLTGKCGIGAYRSRLDGNLLFKFYNSNKQKDYQTVNIAVLCNWVLVNGTTEGGLVAKNCARSR